MVQNGTVSEEKTDSTYCFSETVTVSELFRHTPIYVKTYETALFRTYEMVPFHNFNRFLAPLLQVKMGIYRPKVVMKSKPTRAEDREHSTEVICLHEDDYNHHGDPDFFPIKLAYNGIHHYLPIVQRSVANFMDDYNSAIYHLVNARSQT